MRFDILCTPLTPRKGQTLLRHIHEGAARRGIDARIISGGEVREGAWIMLYGLGGPDRIRHANCGRLIAFDAGYWDRKLSPETRKYRVSMNGFHCPEAIQRVPCAGKHRWSAADLDCAAAGGKADGPIMLVGNGPKSVAIGARGWTAEKSREVRRLFPGRRILYRPKPKRPPEPSVDHDAVSSESIDAALLGVSLVVCRHSNVAVDACRAGVPAVCDDGAAASIYPRSLRNWERQPSHAQRIDFLERIAWWQWSPVECRDGGFWPWMLGALDALR